jgi:hypothetical protein
MDGYNKELIDEKFKVVNHRIDDLETEVKDIKNLTLAVTKVNAKVENIEINVNEIKQDIKNINNKPVELIDKVKIGVISSIATGIIAAVLALILK